MAKHPQRHVPRLSEQEIRTLAMRMFRHEIYLMWANEPDITMVFMPLALGALADARLDYVRSIGAVYSTLDREGGMIPGRAVNGHPMFVSCSFVNAKDCIPLWWEYEKLLDTLPKEDTQ